jgi:hypothetical protein
LTKKKCVIVLTDDDGKKTVSRQGETVCQICDLNYYWPFRLDFIDTLFIYLYFGSALEDISIIAPNPFFSIQLRRIIKKKCIIRNFFYFFFGYLSFDRWLLSQGQTDRAVSILKTFARINKKQVDESVYKKLKVIDIFSQIFIYSSLLYIISYIIHQTVCGRNGRHSAVLISNKIQFAYLYSFHTLFIEFHGGGDGSERQRANANGPRLVEDSQIEKKHDITHFIMGFSGRRLRRTRPQHGQFGTERFLDVQRSVRH